MRDERGERKDERGEMKDERGERKDISGESVKSFNPKTSVKGASCYRLLQVSHYSLLFQRYDF